MTSDRFLGGPPVGRGRRLVPVDDAAFRIDADDRLAHCVEQPGLELQRLFGDAVVGDVADVEDDGVDGRVGEVVGGTHLGPTPDLVASAEPELDHGVVSGFGEHPGEVRPHVVGVIGVDVAQPVGIDEAIGSVAEQALDRWAHVGDHTPGVHETDDL